MYKQLKIYSLVAAAALAQSAGAQAKLSAESTAWYPVAQENKPYTRWWLLGSAVDSAGITYNFEQFAEKGIGGVEITPIYGVKGNEANDVEYLSEKWMDLYGHIVDEGLRLGVEVDMNNGTGWPFGGPNVTTDYSARKLIVEQWALQPGGRADFAIVPSDKKQKPIATLQRVIGFDGNKRIDLTSKVRADGSLDWKAPGKRPWTIYAIFSGRTFQKVKRAAPGGEGFVLNHYDSVAVKHYLNRFDEAFAASGKPFPNSFFNDSYEVYGANWDDRLLDEFFKHHGYRLETYIPEFAADASSLAPDAYATRCRVVRDYRYTLGRMLEENFTKVWADWCHGHGCRARNQSHGSPANLVDLYAMVDVPECESFGQSDIQLPGLHRFGPSRHSDADMSTLKLASSAAHLTGKPLTSAESLTWLTEHFCTSLADCKPELDRMFCAGVNHVYFHGSPYSPAGAAFPGYMFYASVNMSPTGSMWPDSDALFSYISRVQSFMSAGSPDSDFLLYFPIEDIWSRADGAPYLTFEIHKMGQLMPEVKASADAITNAGYDYDFVTDSLLEVISVADDGKLKANQGGTEYKAIIVPEMKTASPHTLRKLMSLAEAGATVIFVGEMPDDVPGMSHRKADKRLLDKLVKRMPRKDGIKCPFGHGFIVRSSSVASDLALVAAPEEMRTKSGLTALRRRNEIGGRNYFACRLNDEPSDEWVALAEPAEAVVIYDPITGNRGFAQLDNNVEGKTLIRLQMAPGESLLLKTFPKVRTNIMPPRHRPEFGSWPYVESKGQPIVLEGEWTLSFPNSEPAIADTFSMPSPQSWTELPSDVAKVNFGTGRYAIKFYIDNPAEADDWLLDLGDVRESAAVRVNGRLAGKAWCVPFALKVGEYLRPGENILEVDVTNLQINRIIDFEKRGVEWRVFKNANIASVTNAKQFSFADWPIAPSGLNSQVTLTPIIINK